MATQYPVTTIGGMSALGQPMGVSQANPFWMALANKAELAADYLSSVNRAQTNYLTGRTEIVGGDLAIMLPGMLQHQADLQISQSAATRNYNKATVETAGQRDRTLANARTNLAAAKGTWEQGLVSQTDTNTTVVKPSLDPPTTQTPTASATARQLSTLFSGGLVSAEPTPQQNGTSNADATDEDLETILIDETPAPVDPPTTWSPPSLAELAPDLASQGLNPPLPEVPVAAIEQKPVTPSLPPLTTLPEDALTELDLAIIDAELAGDQLRDDLHEAWKKKSKDLWDKYGSISGLATLHRDLVSGFANGLLVDGLWGDIEGIGSLIGGTASYLWDATDRFGRSLGEGWHGYFSGDPLHKGFGEYGEEAFEDELEFIDRAMEAAEALRDGLKNADKQKSRFEEALRESMAGHPEKLDAMPLEYGDVGKLTGLLIRNLMYEIGTWAIEEGIDPETAGRIAGYLAYEALLVAASGGIKALAESGQAAKWLDRVADSAATNSAENATLIMRFLRRPGVRYSLSGLASIGWALTSNLCFVAGTPVRTPSGSVAIESLKVGDLVLSRSDRGGLAGDVRSRRVTALHVTNPIELLHLTLSTVGGASASDGIPSANLTETISGTANHPFYSVTAGRFVPAGDLLVGDVISLAEGTAVVVETRQEIAEPGQSFTTYNITVEDDHTYFVGRVGVWVHNTGEAECIKLAGRFALSLEQLKDKSLTLIKFRDEIRKVIATGGTASEQAAHRRHIAKALGVRTGDLELFLNGSVNDRLQFIRRYGDRVAAATEVAHDSLNRIKSVKATIQPKNLYGGSRASRKGIDDGDDAGHIIGSLLGGLGGVDSNNVFGQLPKINRGAFRDFERAIAEEVLEGKLVEVEVILKYADDSTRPTSVIYKVKVDGVYWKNTTFPN